MTRARQILRGTCYEIIRRCSERRFFLRPSKDVNAMVRYILAYCARKHGIRLHAFCVLSNHLHLVLTDKEGRLPAFCQDAFSLIARALNPKNQHWESFWSPGSYSAIQLESPDTIVEKIAYTLANPVAAGLVRHAREWPGLWSPPSQIGGEPEDVPRPDTFFSPRGRMPLSVPLQLDRPDGFESDDAFDAPLAEALGPQEDQAVAKIAAEGRGFLGIARVLAQKPTARPASFEPRRGLNPRVACRHMDLRIDALARLQDFLVAYREALARWKTGVRDALFPPGTYLMRLQHGVRCATFS